MTDLELLTPREVAKLTKVSVQSLANWRTARRGPPWTRIESAVRYPSNLLRTWLEARTVGNPDVEAGSQGQRGAA